MKKKVLLLIAGAVGTMGLVACGKDDKASPIAGEKRILTKEELLKIEADPNHGICPDTKYIYSCVDSETKEEALFSLYAFTEADGTITMQMPGDPELDKAMGREVKVQPNTGEDSVVTNAFNNMMNDAASSFLLDGKVNDIFGFVNYISSCNEARTLKLRFIQEDIVGALLEFQKVSDKEATLDVWKYDNSEEESENTQGKVVHKSIKCVVVSEIPNSMLPKSIVDTGDIDALVNEALVEPTRKAEAILQEHLKNLEKIEADGIEAIIAAAREAIAPYLDNVIYVSLKEPMLGNQVNRRQPVKLKFVLNSRSSSTYSLMDGFVGPTDDLFFDDYDITGNRIYIDYIKQEVFIYTKGSKIEVIGTIDSNKDMSIDAGRMSLDSSEQTLHFF